MGESNILDGQIFSSESLCDVLKHSREDWPLFNLFSNDQTRTKLHDFFQFSLPCLCFVVSPQHLEWRGIASSWKTGCVLDLTWILGVQVPESEKAWLCLVSTGWENGLWIIESTVATGILVNLGILVGSLGLVLDNNGEWERWGGVALDMKSDQKVSMKDNQPIRNMKEAYSKLLHWQRSQFFAAPSLKYFSPKAMIDNTLKIPEGH